MAAISIVRLAHVAVRTSDPESIESHFTDVLGLWEIARDEDGRVHLSVDGLGASLEVIPSDEALELDHVAWEVGADVQVPELVATLKEHDVEATELDRTDVGTSGGVALRDTDGNLLHLVIPEKGRQPKFSGRGIAPLRLGHYAMTTPNPAALRSFYETTLGFRWSDTIEDTFEFLRHGYEHHSLNLTKHGRPKMIQHIAFELTDWAHVHRSSEDLVKRRLPVLWGPGRHGAGGNIFTYHRSPLGIVEFYTEMDHMSHPDQGFFDPRPWHEYQPQTPRHWVDSDWGSMNAWGQGLPDAMRG